MTKQSMLPKHKLLAKNLAKHHGDQKAAYLDTYPEISVRQAASAACRTIAKYPEIKSYAAKIMYRNGLDEDLIAKKLKQKLECTKSIVVNNETKEVPDNTSQLKAAELSMKALSMIKDNDNSVNINYQHNQMQLITAQDTRLDKLVNMFSNLMRGADNALDTKPDNEPDNVIDASPTT